MEEFKITSKNKDIILALGAESAGNFSVYMPASKLSPLYKGRIKEGSKNGTIYFSEDFGDLLVDTSFNEYKHRLNEFLRKEKIKPTVILSDLHPLFRTTELAKNLAKKYKAKHVPIQHHIAHIFSAIGDQIVERGTWNVEQNIIGIACDGTGYGLDEKIWGGEMFKISNFQFPISKQNEGLTIERIAHLENQILIGGEMAIREPARLIIGIINKFPISNFQFPIKSQFSNVKNKKDLAYALTKKYYSRNDFEVLWNQLGQNFNCLETSSTARILDAVSVLLGFSKNERLSKHGPVALLEQNSGKPYLNLKPRIEKTVTSHRSSVILNTTHLFEYLIENFHKDKKRLAATAQKYIADGLLEISNQSLAISNQQSKKKNQLPVTGYQLPVFFSGGMANNKIISSALGSKGVYTNKKIPRGDAGLSFGQIFYYLLADSRD